MSSVCACVYLHQHELFRPGVMDVEPAVRHGAAIAPLHTGGGPMAVSKKYE